jgi:hypothetical protein
MRRTPPIGTKGIYQLKVPFSVPPTKIFTCEAVRTFDDLYKRNRDVFTEFYLANGLTDENFQSDRRAGAAIITLISEDQEVVYVPDTYILSFPDMGMVNYQRVILSLDFGALPEYVNLDYTMTQMTTIAGKVLGRVPDIELHVAPTTQSIGPVEHQSLEAARLAQIEFEETDYAKYLKQLRINQDLSARLATLERLVIDKGLLD